MLGKKSSIRKKKNQAVINLSDDGDGSTSGDGSSKPPPSDEKKDQTSQVQQSNDSTAGLRKNKRSDSEDSQDPRDLQDPRDPRDPRDLRDPRDPQNSGDRRQAQDGALAEEALVTMLGDVTMGRTLVQSLTYKEFMALRAVSKRVMATMDGHLAQRDQDLARRVQALSAPARSAFLFFLYQDIGRYASPFQILHLARQFPFPLHSELWRAFGLALNLPDAGPGEILARLAALNGWLGDAGLRQEIGDLTQDKERRKALLREFDLAATELNPLLHLETGTLSFEMPDESLRGLSGTKAEQIRDAVHKRLKAKMETIKDEIVHAGGSRTGWSDKYRRRIAVDENLATQRALDRLAWVLAHLEDARECVAVAHTEGELHVWANNPDDEMEKHLKMLIEAGREQDEAEMEDLTTTFDDLWDLLEKSSLDVRSKEGGDLHMAERRLLKAIRFLADLQQKWAELKVSAHEETYNLGGVERKVHTEMQAATQLLQNRDRARAKAKRDALHLMDTIVIAIGISKLCCLKCYLGILAMREQGIRFDVTGTHLTTYAWPVSPALVAPALLKAILGVPAKPTSKEDIALAAAIDDELQRKAVIKAIDSFDHSGGMDKTGYVSSEDEEGLEFTYAPRQESDSGSEPESDEGTLKRTRDDSGEGRQSENDEPEQKKPRNTAWQEWQDDMEGEESVSEEDSEDDYESP